MQLLKISQLHTRAMNMIKETTAVIVWFTMHRVILLKTLFGFIHLRKQYGLSRYYIHGWDTLICPNIVTLKLRTSYNTLMGHYIYKWTLSSLAFVCRLN